MSRDTSGPAFARPACFLPGYGEGGGDEVSNSQEGMTVRQWLTGQALVGAMSSTKHSTPLSQDEINAIARRAVKIADATLLELDR